MNAKRLIVFTVFALILMGFFVWITGVFINDAARKRRLWREKAQDVTDAVEYVNSRQYDIMVYGENWDGPKELRVRKIYNFDPDSLIGTDPDFVHYGHILIINDITGTAPMDADKWKKVHDLLTHEGYVVVYFGAAQLPAMQEAGFFFDVYSETTRSVILWNNGLSYEIGFADNTLILPEVVRQSLTPSRLPSFVMVMKMVEKHYF